MNSSKILLRWLVFIISIVGIALYATVVFPQTKIEQTKTQNIVSPGKIVIGYPVLLKVPRINVNSTVEYVGLISDGSMDVPKGPANVA